MEFEQKTPDWKNIGAEPPEELKTKGFTAGYKPPAGYFNWFWHKVGECLRELQEKLKGLTKADVGLNQVDNTSDLNKPVSKAVQVELERKVDKIEGKELSTNDYSDTEKQKLADIDIGANRYTHPEKHPASIITQNAENRFVTDVEKSTWSNKAETTAATTSANGLMTAADKAKLDGIAAGAEVNQNAFQTVRAGGVNIQASGTTAQVELVAGNNLTITGDNGTKKITITGPNAVKNPAALAVQLNGSTAVSYDGSAAKTVNVTPAGIGAAAAGHIHDDRYYTEAETNNLLNGKANNNAAVFTGSISMGRKSGTAVGTSSSAFGRDVEASGPYTYAGGYLSVALKDGAHAEGCGTTANGVGAHAEGYNNNAVGTGNVAYGRGSHVEGVNTIAGTAEGANSFVAAHAEGFNTTASGGFSHAEGNNTIASGTSTHAEGNNTIASGNSSHAEGNNTVASGLSSHAEGSSTVASGWCHTAIGRYNIDAAEYNVLSNPFIIGNGNSDNARLNIFRVHQSGAVYAKGTYNTGGADYAEYFEWMDQNKEREDRVGYFVTLDGDKIKIANPGDYILGIVSATPSVIGNSYEDQWQGRDTKDVWGRTIYERTEHKQEDGTVLIADEPIITQSYNTKTVYIPRSKRPEWSPVGMLGVLAVREDGTCQVNGYCQVANGGIATAADGTEEYALVNGQITKRYRVIERVTDHIVKIVFR